jgi:hypothetical protein
MLFVMSNRRLPVPDRHGGAMTGLVWLNVPLCAIAFIATVGIPLRLVLTDPGGRTEARRQPGRGREREYELAA